LTRFRRKKIVPVFFRHFFAFMSFRRFHRALVLLMAICLPLHAAVSREDSSRRATPNTSRAEPPVRQDHVLQPEDVIRVYVFQEDDINKLGEVRISKEYTITLPLVGMVDLRGLTTRQAEQKITALYDKDFIVNPQVTVTVLKHAERTVNVMGAVNSPGRVSFPPERGLTLAQAIALAGGHSRLADLKKVKLTRRAADGDTRMEEINVDEIMKRGARDVLLQEDDVILVPERIL
jgi:polysaccharide biosynthesis/export protein